jgi:hypothetical protein
LQRCPGRGDSYKPVWIAAGTYLLVTREINFLSMNKISIFYFAHFARN